ncbi:MAG: cysteine desulfurase family protein [Bacteroidota bacterium]
MRVYFDNAATTSLCPQVLEAMLPYLREEYGNPSSTHTEGRRTRAAIERARKTIANAIGASIGEIFFTSGGTESNNMALKCAVRDLGVTRIISSPIEHHCVLHSVETLGGQGIQVDMVEIDTYGRVNYEQLEQLLQHGDQKTIVSLMHANNEIGTLLDLGRVSQLCQEYGAYLHSDTVQTVGHFPIDVNKTPINFLSGAAHKFHGPKGIGFIYISNNNIVKPYIDGGAQERNMRGGTENLYGIIGLAKALELAIDEMDERVAKIKSVRSYLKEKLQERVQGIRFNEDPDNDSLYTVLSVSFPPSPKSELLLMSLDIAGISVSGGSACSSGSDVGSHVMQGIKAPLDYKAVRFSFCHNNTKEEVDYLMEKLTTILPAEHLATVA